MGASANAAIVEFTASPERVEPGEPVTVSWQATQAQRCSLSSQGKTRWFPATFSVTAPVEEPTTVTLRCGDSQEQLSIDVVDDSPDPGPGPEPDPDPGARDLDLSIVPEVVEAGGTTTISWNAGWADRCQGRGHSVPTVYSHVLTVSETSTYTLTCDGVTESVTARVEATPEPDPGPGPGPDPDPTPDAGWPAEVPVPFSYGDDLPACPAPTNDDPDWWVLSGSHCVSTGLDIVGAGLRVQGDHIVVRDFEVDGNGVSEKTGVAIKGSNIVILRGSSHHLLGNDKHCYTAHAGSSDVWLIDSEGYYCSGDGFQAGHQDANNRPRNLYLVRNTFHENRENGIDLKYTSNVIAVENEIYGMRSSGEGPYCLPDMPNACSPQSSGSDGTGIIIGSDGGPQGWAFYRNVVHDSDGCIRVEEAETEGTFEGNHCHDIAETAVQLDKESGRIAFVANTIERAGRGIFQNWRDNFSLAVTDNVFRDLSGPAIEYEQSAVWQASTLRDNAFIDTGPVIYGDTRATSESQINALPGAGGNTVE